MSQQIFQVPEAVNEPIRSYAPGTPEREALKRAIEEARSEEIEIPMFIGGKEIKSGNLVAIRPPHDFQHVLGHYHQGDGSHVKMAIKAALEAKEKWADMSWQTRASIFLKAASLLAGPYRDKINAATMLGQSKNVYQAEIDSACESIDFFRFNVQYMAEIYSLQPKSDANIWNRLEQRPLEGFIFALTPFNFTSIAANLPTAPAIMGNTVVWKPSKTQVFAAHVLMDVYREAGLPDGVINLVFVSGPVAGKEILTHPDFAGFHFTGSTEVFYSIWKQIGDNIQNYKTYPRIVGETGGKDFIMVHGSAKPEQVVTAIIRGGFEYQGQKCSAVSRVYIPDNLWPKIKELMANDLKSLKMGGVEDFSNFMNAIIDEVSYDNLVEYIENARKDPDAEIIFGGNYDKSKGYFIEPTVILTKYPQYVTMVEELFGPVVTVYVYESGKYEETLDLLDKTSIYALTGAIFAKDKEAIETATKKLVNAAGNFHINDKPTGAVVGQQPFGGSRASGTNDKAGSMINLLRWVSPRTIKENFVPPEDYRYPFMNEK
ncbi:MAG: L-glutamate gamma-semialdehyde dehydrogenase [Bacteroidetes bacterium]|nr:L-glutamate gamma-semialdehyde dehydrogenase [Bacteroidota bacterium]